MLRKMALAVVTAAMTATFAGPVSALDVKLEEVAAGLQHPLLLTSPPGDPRRFIIEQIGTVKVLQPDGKMSTFLDIKEKKFFPLSPNLTNAACWASPFIRITRTMGCSIFPIP